MLFFLYVLMLAQATSFIIRTTSFRTSSRHLASGSSANVVVTGNNVDLTEALVDYTTLKMNKSLNKLLSSSSSSGKVTRCEVHLTVGKNPKVHSQKCEATTVIRGSTIRSVVDSADMYNSIDLVSDQLFKQLTKYKSRRLGGFHKTGHMGEDFANDAEDDMEMEIDMANVGDENKNAGIEEDDKSSPKVTKVKSFDLSKSISIEEAILALDYIDHDFYVFRDEASKEVSVIYKRNSGGLGLIQPTSD
ncbi:hypothetical protein ScalyP_jg833 [Parmales sp. scaly parma]|nr:hypothetical protein ScalyP_jg833 [Parmales sp. scaly parma]